MSGFWESLFGQDDEPKGKEKKVPDTLVEVICEGCTKPINVRIQEKHRLRGQRTMQCHNCLHIIEVYVYTGGQVTVYQSEQNGTNRHQTGYTKVYQE